MHTEFECYHFFINLSHCSEIFGVLPTTCDAIKVKGCHCPTAAQFKISVKSITEFFCSTKRSCNGYTRNEGQLKCGTKSN
jgi:hypothetical protein